MKRKLACLYLINELLNYDYNWTGNYKWTSNYNTNNADQLGTPVELCPLDNSLQYNARPLPWLLLSSQRRLQILASWLLQCRKTDAVPLLDNTIRCTILGTINEWSYTMINECYCFVSAIQTYSKATCVEGIFQQTDWICANKLRNRIMNNWIT